MLRTVFACLMLSAATVTTVDAQLVAASLQVDPQGNSVLDPGETAALVPSWRNPGTAFQLGGPSTLSNFTGPAGATYTVADGNGSYPNFLPLAGPLPCSDCYSIGITATGRPSSHWDATVHETLNFNQKSWTLHVGATFTDVPAASPFYRFVETIVHKDVTGGCGTGVYCPTSGTTREQMAVFVLLAREPRGYTPPACGASPMFGDVPVASPFCRWIEELARRGVVAGCGGGNFCPAATVTRDQMAVFVLRTLDPALNPPACGAPVFADVPASSPFCAWVEELARRGVVSGCGGGNYCPASAVTREQMSVFLTVTFGLLLYAP